MSTFRESFKLKCLDHQLFRHFMEHTMKAEFISIFILVDIAIPAAAVWLKGFEDHFVSVRTKLLHIKFRICVSFEDKLPRGIKFPRDEEFLFTGFGSNFCGIIFFHYYQLLFKVLSG